MSYIPEGYEAPAEPQDGMAYWLAEQPEDRATFLVMVIKKTPGEQRIIAEMCYLEDGVKIVDALRGTEKAKREGEQEAANAFVKWASKNEIGEPPLDWAWFGEISRRYSSLHEEAES